MTKLTIEDGVIDAAYEVAQMEPTRDDVEVMLEAAFGELGMTEEWDYSQSGPTPKKPRYRLVSDWRIV